MHFWVISKSEPEILREKLTKHKLDRLEGDRRKAETEIEVNQALATNLIGSHLDVTQIFYDVDDFYQQFEQLWQQRAQLLLMLGEKHSRSRLPLSEVITIDISLM